MNRLALPTLAATVCLALAGCGSDSTTPTAGGSPTPSSSMTKPSGQAMAPGAYYTKAEYEMHMAERTGSHVIYFFHATWCPDCRATDAALKKTGVPEGYTVVQVDYDTETDLKKTYGITVQDTFVAVDADGKELKKVTGPFASGTDLTGALM